MSAVDPKDPAAPIGDQESAEQAVERLTAELAAHQVEAERFRDLYLRERAEMENYKKRVQRDHSESLRYAAAQLTRDLADVIDNLERAVDHAGDGGGNGKPLVDGVRMVLQGALDALSRHGITRIDATGETFDPNRHEAVASVHVPDTEPNRVVQQFQPGYVLHDRVVRPAKVSVSAKPVEPPSSDD
jgi:molecular chaperone GrpE